jgi:hypothetical protein
MRVRAARTRSSRSRIATSSTHPTPVGPPSRPHSSGTRDPVKLADSPPGLSQGCQPASRGHVHLPQTRTMEEQSTVKVTVDSLITFKLKVGAKRHRCSLKTPTLNLFDLVSPSTALFPGEGATLLAGATIAYGSSIRRVPCRSLTQGEGKAGPDSPYPCALQVSLLRCLADQATLDDPEKRR